MQLVHDDARVRVHLDEVVAGLRAKGRNPEALLAELRASRL